MPMTVDGDIKLGYDRLLMLTLRICGTTMFTGSMSHKKHALEARGPEQTI